MTCETYRGAVVCYGPETELFLDERDGKDRWCFRCRKIREFRIKGSRTIEPSYYDPNFWIQCGTCGLTDGDLFPGRYREWDY